MSAKLIACCGLVNRGLAILGDRLFMATLDACTTALDRKIGHLLWGAEVIDYSLGHSGTRAPLVVEAGGEDPAGDEKAFAQTRQSGWVPIVATQSTSRRMGTA